MQPETLYSINYLEQTTAYLKNIKQRSYEPFLAIGKGLVADVGCGTGDDAINLANALGAPVAVVGVDQSEEMIAKAKQAGQGIDNLSFEIGDAGHLPFATGSLDGLRNERLLQHLPDPEAAFREFHRCLKDGAPLVCVETDWSSIRLYNGSSRTRKALYDYMADHNVRNGLAATTLVDDLRAHGFHQVRLSVFPMGTPSLAICKGLLRTDHALAQMRETGILDDAAYQDFERILELADQQGQFACSINIVIVSAIK